jgi:casein kinase II subunit alpha
VYANVNEKLGRSWWDYGESGDGRAIKGLLGTAGLLGAGKPDRACPSVLPDNLTVHWGIQDQYEIVRKVGRGKYSEVGV